MTAPSSKRQSSASRRSQLVEAAMRILATDGVRRLTAQHLADEVGLTQGAIFRHFASMDEILNAVIDRAECVLFEGFPPEAPDPIARMKAFFLQRAQIIASYDAIAALLIAERLSLSGDSACAARVRGFKRRTQQFVLACLEEAHACGALHRSVAPEDGAVLVMGAILALAHGGTAGRRDRPGVERVWTVIERALFG